MAAPNSAYIDKSEMIKSSALITSENTEGKNEVRLAKALSAYAPYSGASEAECTNNFKALFYLDHVMVFKKVENSVTSVGVLGLVLRDSDNSKYHKLQNDEGTSGRKSRIELKTIVEATAKTYYALNDAGLNTRAKATITAIGTAASSSGTPSISDIAIYLRIKSAYYLYTSGYRMKIWTILSGTDEVIDAAITELRNYTISANSEVNIVIPVQDLQPWKGRSKLRAQITAVNEEGEYPLTDVVAFTSSYIARGVLTTYRRYNIELTDYSGPTSQQLETVRANVGTVETIYYDRYDADSYNMAPFPNPNYTPLAKCAKLYTSITGETPLSQSCILLSTIINPGENPERYAYIAYGSVNDGNTNYGAAGHIIFRIGEYLRYVLPEINNCYSGAAVECYAEAFPSDTTIAESASAVISSASANTSYAWNNAITQLSIQFTVLDNTGNPGVQNTDKMYAYLIGTNSRIALLIGKSLSGTPWLNVHGITFTLTNKAIAAGKANDLSYVICLTSYPLTITNTKGRVTEIIDLTT